MRVLVTGGNGQLGTDVLEELKKNGHIVLAPDSKEMDITDLTSVTNVFAMFKPEVVIHCAAYTAVDLAEDESVLCRNVNTVGTEHIALCCKKADCKLIYISTDYIFDGNGKHPWEPDDQTKGPVNVYGLTKYEGELAVKRLLTKFYIVRISWVFGLHGANFVKTMLRLGTSHKELSVVDDQYGAPTYTKDLAVLLSEMAVREEYGTYHACNTGETTWYEFAKKIFEFARMSEVTVNPVASEAFPTKAKRPHNSRMSTEKLKQHGFLQLPDWKDALKRFLIELKENENGKN